jgi:hypothetical protein
MIDKKQIKIWKGQLPRWNLIVEKDSQKGYNIKLTGLENFFLNGSVHLYIHGIMVKDLQEPFYYLNIEKDLYIFKAVLSCGNAEYIHNGEYISRIVVMNRDNIQNLGHPVMIAEKKMQNKEQENDFRNQEFLTPSQSKVSDSIASKRNLQVKKTLPLVYSEKIKMNKKKFKKIQKKCKRKIKKCKRKIKKCKQKNILKSESISVGGDMFIKGNNILSDKKIRMGRLNVCGDVKIENNNTGLNDTNIRTVEINGSLIMRNNNLC